ncbi:MAG: TlpA disulfide reductase family protein [Paludibacter sp.]|nr:TlpA disulfide reductase family protein [Paludibacter sp.]
MKKLFILSMAVISLNCFAQSNKPIQKIVNFAQLQTVLQQNDNKLCVVNFWATWCKPCVKELPGFMEVNKTYRDKPGFKMILVSLDMASEMDTHVKAFLLKNNIDTDVYLLDDNKRMNEWIPAIDKKWSGAIPATVIYRNGRKVAFEEGELSKEELVKMINNYL